MKPGLCTDLYELTMAAAYYEAGRNDIACFELFVRNMPEARSYMIAAGLEQAVEYIQSLRFDKEDIDFLKSQPGLHGLSKGFAEYLRKFRFSGDVWAVPEGTLVFPGEPLISICAPLIEAQIIETFLLATINHQTAIASKASRIVYAAQGRGVIDFGARRAHGFNSAVYGARAAFIGGCIGTSNIEAGRMFNIPLYGTAAHSFVMAFDSEEEAFHAYYDAFPDSTTLLIDTYDVIEAAHKATVFGKKLKGVRIDSGDLSMLSKQVRQILDDADLKQTVITASGDLNEYKISELLALNSPIDLFGVGTELLAPSDSPALGGVYKLVEVDKAGSRIPKVKRSNAKATIPYRKQVWRSFTSDGKHHHDTISIFDETHHDGEPLLKPIIEGGEMVTKLPSINNIRIQAIDEMEAFPPQYKKLIRPIKYPVNYSDSLKFFSIKAQKS